MLLYIPIVTVKQLKKENKFQMLKDKKKTNGTQWSEKRKSFTPDK